jgi:hypothetical protein
MFFSALSIFAQPVIQFDDTTIDFGTIKEEGGKASRKFEFTNTGDKDLLLVSVKPGCGCTAADYTKTAVAPGQKGFIQATYDPYNRPGNFHKNIKVTTNEEKFTDASSESPHVIYIKGNVEKRAPTKYETAGYKNGIGNVRIMDNTVKLDILNTESKTFTIQAKNFLDKESTFEPTNMPNYITTDKTNLMAGEEKTITFKYDAVKRGEIGAFRDIITIQTKDSIEPKITLFVESTVMEDFSKLTAKQLQEAPKAGIDTLLLDFGKVEKNSSPTLQVKLHNTGKNPLIIRQVKSSNTIFNAVFDKMEVPKGGFATLAVTLTSRNRRGSQNTQIEIVTNDPTNATMLLNCKGDISQ